MHPFLLGGFLMYIRVDKNAKLIKDHLGGSLIKKIDNKKSKFEVNLSGVEIFKLCDGTNTADGIVDIIKNRHLIDNTKSINDISKFIDEYINNGILVSSKSMQKTAIEEIGDSNLIIPEKLSLEITNQCQLKCIHCFNSSGNQRENELDVDQFINIADKFSKLGTKDVFITGGEVFLKEEINKLIYHLSDKFENVTIATNAYTLSEDNINLLNKCNNVNIQVSIDGKKETHDNIRGVIGSYEKSINNMKRLSKFKIPVAIAFTANDYNIDDLEDIICVAREIGCMAINISLTAMSGRAKENGIPLNLSDKLSDIILKYNKQYSEEGFTVGSYICEEEIEIIENSIEFPNKCGAGYNVIHIFSDGQTSICPAIRNINLGNILHSNIEDILYYKNIQALMNIPTPNLKSCGDCESYSECGKCIANMLLKTKEECLIVNEMQL